MISEQIAKRHLKTLSEQIAKRYLKTSAELQHLNCSCDGCAKRLATVINDTVEDELKTRSLRTARRRRANCG